MSRDDDDNRAGLEAERFSTRTLGPPASDRATRIDASLDAGSPADEIGRKFGRFEIRDVLGSGGMGTVFEVHDTMLDRAVALKLLHPEMAERAERRLLREAKALARLSHPHVVRIFEAGIIEGRAFIAMELVRGQDLSHWQSCRRSWRECVEVYLQAGRGLAAAHAEGLVHRDFKPGNCIIDASGHVRVLDFGLARPVDPNHRIGAISMDEHPSSDIGTAVRPVGTLGYMPLEQLWGQPIDAQSDQFSYCVSLFEAVYGQRPFSAPSMDTAITAMLEGTITSHSQSGGVPPRLFQILSRGLRARPRDRWPSMDVLLRELERLLGGRPRRRRPWALAGVGALVLTSVVWWSLRADPCDDPRAELRTAWAEPQIQQARASLRQLGEPLDPLLRLDAHATRWVGARRALCEAEREPGVADGVLAARGRCLDEARDALREVGELLADPEPCVVTAALATIDDLLDPDRCTQAEDHVPLRPLPEDPDQAERAHALRLQAARAAAWLREDRHEAALAQLEPAIAEAEALGFGPLQAELELLLGTISSDQGHYARANDQLEQAYARATEHGHPFIALQAASALTYVVGDLLDEHQAGLQWGLTAEALARQPWASPTRRIYVQELIGNIYYEQGQYQQALDRYRRALDARMKLDPDDPMLVLTRANVGLVLTEQGRYEEALPELLDVLEHRVATLPPEHQAIAFSRLQLATVLRQLGRHDEATALLHQALDAYEQTLGPEHPGVGLVLVELGRELASQGALAEALGILQRALALTTRIHGASHSHVADCWLALGELLHAMGQLDAAKRHLERGVRILEQSVGPRHVSVGNAWLALGRLELQRGDRAAAREHLERAVELLAEGQGPPTDLADARFALARVLHTFPGERDPARTLAQHARRTYAEHGELARPRLEMIDAWLAGPEPQG